MKVNRQDAVRALSEAEEAQRKVVAHDDYRNASVHVFIWAVVWFGANTALALFPMNTGPWTWPAAGAVGVAASFFAAIFFRIRRDEAPASNSPRPSLRPFATALAFFLFFWAVFDLLPGVGPRAGSAFVCLVTAFSYIVLGVWMGWRLSAIGIVSALLVLVGYHYVQQHLLLWLAFVGGASLVAGGFWLRRV